MERKTLFERLEEYIAYLKKHSFGDSVMRKRTFSVLEKLLLFIGIGIGSIIIAVAFVIFPGLTEVKEMKQTLHDAVANIYGANNDQGLKFIYESKREELRIAEEEFAKQQHIWLEKLEEALPKEDKVYDLVSFLEDYTVTMHTEDKPMVLKSVSLGKVKSETIPVNELKQSQENGKIIIPAEYKVIPLSVSIEAHREKFEQFLRFIQHSGDLYAYHFKGKPVPIMSVESLNLPVDQENDNEEKKQVQTYALQISAYFQK